MMEMRPPVTPRREGADSNKDSSFPVFLEPVGAVWRLRSHAPMQSENRNGTQPPCHTKISPLPGTD